MQSKAQPELALPTRARLRIGSQVTLVDHREGCWNLTGRAAVVLACVALEGPVERRRLSALLWSDSTPAQARSNLRVLTHRLNQGFGGELLLGADRLALNPQQVEVEWQDVDAVLGALSAGGPDPCEWLAESGMAALAGDDLQAWLASARQRLKQALLARLGDALTEALALERHTRAAALARACVQLDPLSERRHRRLMEVLMQAGDRAAALSAYEHCHALLKQNLGVPPGKQTRQVHVRILQEAALSAGLAGAAAPAAAESLGSRTSQPQPLVERDAVLAQAQYALSEGVHVIVQGEPGVGKTRLLAQLMTLFGASTEHVALHAALHHEPYAALAQLLQEVQPRRRPRIGMAEQVELARLAPLAFADARPSNAALSAPRLHAALRHWFARLVEVGVQVLVLDDVHHADPASQAAMADLLAATWGRTSAPTTAAVERLPSLLMAHRSVELLPVLSDSVAQAQAQRQARRMELPRLSLQGVQALLEALDATPGSAEPGTLAQHLHKRTGGNPLFVTELARQALDPGETPCFADLQALLTSRLQRCSAPAQQLAAVAAIAPEHFGVELAAAVSGRTALELMPAWHELEQRGLFAAQGLAHDLIRDAVLACVPRAILPLLHRQVALHLESQGDEGSPVLRHWLAANDVDRALPHAVHQLYAASAAGLPTSRHELMLLDLLERASDEVLLAHHWRTADIGDSVGEFAPDEVWRRIIALRDRVQGLSPRADTAAWLAFEAARCGRARQRCPKEDYEHLAQVAARMPPHGVERAHVEHELASLAVSVTGVPHAHLRRAREALAGLPDVPSINRVRRKNEHQIGIYEEPIEGIKAQARRWRLARHRKDMATVADASALMGRLQAFQGHVMSAIRHYLRAARLRSAGGEDVQPFPDPLLVAKIALSAGHYALAHRLLLTVDDQVALDQRTIYLALLQLRLGRSSEARSQLAEIEPAALQAHFVTQIIHGHVSTELDLLQGIDPVPGLRHQWEMARSFGVSGINLDLMAWDLALHTQPLSERLAAAHVMMAQRKQHHIGGHKLVKTVLEIAEVCAEAGTADAEHAAAEAAWLLRRGCTNSALYLPEGLVRCARLIRRHDARESDALLSVARRWVNQALQRLPPGAEEHFSRQVTVNRLLLDGDDDALQHHALH